MQIEEFTVLHALSISIQYTVMSRKKQGFVTATVIDQQVILPILQEVACMSIAAAGLIIKNNNA